MYYSSFPIAKNLHKILLGILLAGCTDTEDKGTPYQSNKAVLDQERRRQQQENEERNAALHRQRYEKWDARRP